MRLIAILLLILFGANLTLAQDHMQTLRGTIIDADNEMPLIGVNIICASNSDTLFCTTDIDGKFRINQVPIGRINLEVTYLGYEDKIIPNIVVNSAKEVILNIKLIESTIKLNEVTVVAHKEKGRALNEMSILSARSISPEETSRYAGGFNDPSRIVANFAGVNTTGDGGNDIIIRGNSPKYIQWRIEGMQITNPNHFGDQSAVGGSVSTLNNNILDNSDFHTGAFTAEYGDVISGVYDVKLRSGNNEKFEAVAGIGLLGMDLTLEGPIKKGYGGSYLVNYRYSTAGLASDLGLLGDLSGIPTFQDAAFKIVLPASNLGVFSIYGLGGKSDFLWEDVDPQTWVTPGDAFMRPEIVEDYTKKAHLINIGLNHTINISDKSYLKSGIIVSDEGVDDEILENVYFLSNGLPNLDSLKNQRINFQNDLDKSVTRMASTYHHKFNAQHKLVVGSKYARFGYTIKQSRLDADNINRQNLLDFSDHIGTLRNFANYKYKHNDRLTVIAGLHNMNVLFNKKTSIESRMAIEWKSTPSLTLHAGFGEHSTMESIHNYFAQINNGEGAVTTPNKELDLLKSDHYVIGLEKKINTNTRLKVEAYYQYLHNLPVENDTLSSYATINETLDFRYVDLVNEGTGKNYGIEATLERYFQGNFYYLINASIYESKYTALDRIERDTRFNGNYTANLLFGKEFPNLGKKENQTLTLNLKAFYSGGKRVTPLIRDEEGNLAVSPEQGIFYDESKPFQKKLDDLYQINLSASYKWNKKKTTHELFLNIDNLTNHKGQISEYYDVEEEGSIGHLTQFGIFPNLMYRVYF